MTDESWFGTEMLPVPLACVRARIINGHPVPAACAICNASAAYLEVRRAEPFGLCVKCFAAREQEGAQKVQAITAIAEALARVIEADPHQWSPRPCATCTAASALLDRPFGCQAKRTRG